MKKLRWLVVIMLAVGVVVLIWEWRDRRLVEEVKREEVELRVAMGADIHTDVDSLEKMLVAAKGKGSSLVILVGDLTKVGARSELVAVRKVLDESGMRFYVVPGNHDWWNQKTSRGAWEEIFGVKYQSFKEGGNKFILVDNGHWLGLGKEQRQWLEGEVLECRVVRCVVVMHMPLQHLWSTHVMGEDSQAVKAEAGELVKLLVDNGVKEIYSGHLHYADSYEIGGLGTNLVGAVTRAGSQKPEFTEVVIGGGEVKKEVVGVE
ncbi:hypothetical protein A3K55_02335 [Candidatus Shapirobacteria bacterium RBG_13_44_7]|uniref:Calcineurin-like phosphoesterase domain-containing protein n=1 Tax=Candidatus Shapirobacteria bacterium RBG_13_44_7 TaxID=1802149 RepID=A0A1F7SGH7_9BACT|nr:MAG: hypothetical protein A3K55_02335 [Candidatus Shapirobacteria bacterium RBG_13_44_7]